MYICLVVLLVEVVVCGKVGVGVVMVKKEENPWRLMVILIRLATRIERSREGE